MTNTKFLGGILLIAGTAIGGGILALPVASAQLGFLNSSLLLFSSWLIMTFSALLILEVNLLLPPESNIISMAKATLGRGGEIVAWVVYLLLLYSLISAYIAGGSDFLFGLLKNVGINTPEWVDTFLFTSILSFIVYQGIRLVDYVNRGLVISKLTILAILVVSMLLFIKPINLTGGVVNKYAITSFTVMLTSFGFANIIPSLRTYFQDDVKKLRLAILIGSIIPLVCYILWDIAIMGLIPRNGQDGLIAIAQSGHSTSDMMNQISTLINIGTITALSRVFTSICIATSFLGVSLSLFDFFADGLKIKKVGKNNLFLYALTFFPPLLVVIFYPTIFIKALTYAGIYCMILLVILPVMMAWQSRYRQQLPNRYQVWGGKPALVISMVVGSAMMVESLIQNI